MVQALHTGRAYVVHSLRFSTQAWIVGFMIWGDDINTYGTSYINWIQTRIMLRSMAARYEAGSYGYCTIVFLAILDVPDLEAHVAQPVPGEPTLREGQPVRAVLLFVWHCQQLCQRLILVAYQATTVVTSSGGNNR